jgi:SAM-dependent methyltransferase
MGQDNLGQGAPATGINTKIAHSARVYDYWLGGKDNFAADREAAEKVLELRPDLRAAVQANRRFLARTVRYLAREAGVRQFLDIGTGLPAANNTHEVAQAVAPEARIVYIDNDPIVLNHARALLGSTPEGACAYLEADLRDPGQILEGAAEVLDFARPVGLMLIGILHLIEAHDDPYGIVARLIAALPPGSYLTISHPASDIHPEAQVIVREKLNADMVQQTTFRSQAEVTRFFTGLDLLDPGVVTVPKWRPDSELEAASPTSAWGGMARKPGQV